MCNTIRLCKISFMILTVVEAILIPNALGLVALYLALIIIVLKAVSSTTKTIGKLNTKPLLHEKDRRTQAARHDDDHYKLQKTTEEVEEQKKWLNLLWISAFVY